MTPRSIRPMRGCRPARDWRRATPFYDRLHLGALAALYATGGDHFRPRSLSLRRQQVALVLDRENGGPNRRAAPYAALSRRRPGEDCWRAGSSWARQPGRCALVECLIGADAVDCWPHAPEPPRSGGAPGGDHTPAVCPSACLARRCAAGDGGGGWRGCFLVASGHAGGRAKPPDGLHRRGAGGEPALGRAVGAPDLFGVSPEASTWRSSAPQIRSRRAGQGRAALDLPEAPKADRIPGAAPWMDPDAPPAAAERFQYPGLRSTSGETGSPASPRRMFSTMGARRRGGAVPRHYAASP